jgi:transcriptional regulator with XRE-family HTH domain
MDTYGERLREARLDKGVSLADATYEARRMLDRKVSERTIGRLETGVTPEESADASLVIALCGLYGVNPDTISVPITERALRERQVYSDVILR